MYADHVVMFMIQLTVILTMALIREPLLKIFRMTGAALSAAHLRMTLKKNN